MRDSGRSAATSVLRSSPATGERLRAVGLRGILRDDAQVRCHRWRVRASCRGDGVHGGWKCREALAPHDPSSAVASSPHARAPGAALDWRRDLLCLGRQPDLLIDPVQGIRRWSRSRNRLQIGTSRTRLQIGGRLGPDLGPMPWSGAAAAAEGTSPALLTAVQAVPLIERGSRPVACRFAL
jgi:hypothetical protein